jgi:hypothetical protein
VSWDEQCRGGVLVLFNKHYFSVLNGKSGYFMVENFCHLDVFKLKRILY